MKLKLYLLGFSRHLEHSTIIYEDPQHSPLLRLSWNKQDPNYLATFSLDALEVCHFAHVVKYNHTCTYINTYMYNVGHFQVAFRLLFT